MVGVRKEPKWGAPIIMQAPVNTQFIILGQDDNNWCEVEVDYKVSKVI